jgi:hypothetical protein
MPPRIPRTPSRRTFLAGSGAAILATTGGCSAVLDAVGDRVLEHVNVFNETTQRLPGSVAVVDPAGETVLDETFELAPSDAASDDGESAAVYADVWTTAGDYEVTVSLTDAEIDGTSRATETVTIDAPDEEMLAIPLGAEDVDAAIGFRVGESLSDF